jgi:hypothetical protein
MKGQAKGRTVDGEREHLCTCCNEWWPATSEFFFQDSKSGSGLMAQCKACIMDKKNAKRKQQRAMMSVSG